jgi:Multicopper oxidase
VRLRFINGSSMSIFDVRIDGLPMTVVQADGNDVMPVTVDEFRISVAETYDVIVQPPADRAHTIFVQAEGIAPEIKFAADSLLEEARFELSVPPAGADLFEVNGTKITGVRERSSRFRQG